MQQQDFTDLQADVVKNLMEQVPEAKKEDLEKKTEEAFRKLTEEEKIMTLTVDEVDLLLAFRKWSASPGSASGVFHWRKQYGK
jgi:hypothetical protein